MHSIEQQRLEGADMLENSPLGVTPKLSLPYTYRGIRRGGRARPLDSTNQIGCAGVNVQPSVPCISSKPSPEPKSSVWFWNPMVGKIVVVCASAPAGGRWWSTTIWLFTEKSTGICFIVTSSFVANRTPWLIL